MHLAKHWKNLPPKDCYKSYPRMFPSYIIQKVFLRLENATVSTTYFVSSKTRFVTEKNM